MIKTKNQKLHEKPVINFQPIKTAIITSVQFLRLIFWKITFIGIF